MDGEALWGGWMWRKKGYKRDAERERKGGGQVRREEAIGDEETKEIELVGEGEEQGQKQQKSEK